MGSRLFADQVPEHDALINGKPVDPFLGWFLTWLFNWTGNPAATLPCGFAADGLPIGLQVVGRRLEDGLVLRLSRAFEQAAPWADRKPDLA